MKKPSVVVLTLAALLLCGPATAAARSGSGPETPGPRVDPDITSGKATKQLRKARKKWRKREIRNYRMTARRLCYCAGPRKAKIRVRNRKPVRISNRPWHGPRTVPGMFRIVAQAIRRKVAVLDVRYNRKFGFPKRTSIDYIAMAADDEIFYRIKRFRILRRAGGPVIWGDTRKNRHPRAGNPGR